MHKRTPKSSRLLVVMCALLLTAFAGLSYRLYYLQIIRHDWALSIVKTNTFLAVFQEPRRGDIRDRRGILLATSLPVRTVCADPTLIGPHRLEVARAVAPILGLSETQLVEKLQPRILNVTTNGEPVWDRYVVLQREVKPEDWDKARAAMTNLSFGVNEKLLPRNTRMFLKTLRQKAVFADPAEDHIRVYPNRSLAAHLLGHTAKTNLFTGGNWVIETRGIDGMERSLNSKLNGIRGWRVSEKDRKGVEQAALREQNIEARQGYNAWLTLDAGLQYIVETELAVAMRQYNPVSVSGIVVRPKTGEILALCNLPNFDPNTPGDSTPDARRNRAISDLQEPGSTFKIVVIAGALNEQIINLERMFDCEMGRFRHGGTWLHDHEPYGILNVQNIIAKSSNIGAAKVGIEMGEQRLYDYMRRFGFGTRSGILLPGEVSGIVNPVRSWSKISISHIPMGHEVAVTPMQMVMAMCAVANRGVLMRPQLLDRLEDRQGATVASGAPEPVRTVLGARAALDMVAALKAVPTAEGTAVKARLDHYTVAGKTGTANKPIIGGRGYHKDKYLASFIGFFPADDPELCISVVLDEPHGGHYGGQTAAPVFRAVAERAASYLRIRPDLGPATTLEVNAAKGRLASTVNP